MTAEGEQNKSAKGKYGMSINVTGGANATRTEARMPAMTSIQNMHKNAAERALSHAKSRIGCSQQLQSADTLRSTQRGDNSW